MAEVIKDVTYRVAPFGPDQARAMIGELRAAALFGAFRGRGALDVEALANAIARVSVLAAQISGANKDTLREMTDWFRQRMPSGVAVLGTVEEGKPQLVASVSDDLTKRGVDAVKLIKAIAPMVGGGGGGKPTLAQAGGKDPTRLAEALAQVEGLVAGALS